MRRKPILNNLLHLFGGKRESSRWGEEDRHTIAVAGADGRAFTYDVLTSATRNFNPGRKLGEGGFGPVFKGRLGDGREVAVKRLGQRSRQGVREFANEARLLSTVQHKNVVNLYGYCVHGADLLLVYEYVANESLDKILFSRGEMEHRRKELDWRQRYEVMLGVARGLLYLHEDAHIPIIHRDIKASNILLNERWVPKIADFGMARLYPEDNTQINTRIAGTNGYMAPEYVMHGTLSTKADVFSFGVLTLEVISGQKNSTFFSTHDGQSLLEWAWILHKKGQCLDLVDTAISSTAFPEEVAKCLHIGLLCVQSEPKSRPDMKRVVVLLSSKSGCMDDPIRPSIPGSKYSRSARAPPASTSYSGESSTARETTTASVSATTSTSVSSYVSASVSSYAGNKAVMSATTSRLQSSIPLSTLETQHEISEC